jgi:hypothetical protein
MFVNVLVPLRSGFSNSSSDEEHTFIAGIPPILQACRESRTEAMKWYKPTFQNFNANNIAYFDRSIDSIYVSSHGSFNQQATFFKDLDRDIAALERITISDIDLLVSITRSDDPSTTDFVPQRMADFNRRIRLNTLEEIIILHGEESFLPIFQCQKTL